jgi:hypothetical protein
MHLVQAGFMKLLRLELAFLHAELVQLHLGFALSQERPRCLPDQAAKRTTDRSCDHWRSDPRNLSEYWCRASDEIANAAKDLAEELFAALTLELEFTFEFVQSAFVQFLMFAFMQLAVPVFMELMELHLSFAFTQKASQNVSDSSENSFSFAFLHLLFEFRLQFAFEHDRPPWGNANGW